MKRFLLVLFIILTWTGGAVAQADDATAPQPVTGTVVSTGNISFAVRTDDGAVKSFFLVSTTTMPGPGLNPGDRVTVAYQPLDDAHSGATGVNLATPNGNPASEPAAAPPPASAEDDSRTWELLAFVRLVGLLMALGVALLAGLFRPHRAERPHRTA